ncbi:hypothetical protein HX109_15500 [Galbibacter sp. BG1]|uniref:hypothetical protein n=1 Tax=Galbibacter sp. BG1 TaxID=1170699 RepID=UPI0015BF88BA|nr:hypothetical protein [Galbibacter sp. BG1]QLE02905.1 hypothetical protein HX109_15500 [Galbibacter sp. BG1]
MRSILKKLIGRAMYFTNGYTTTQIKSDYLKAVVSPTPLDTNYWWLALEVCRVFNCETIVLIGFRDTTEKIVACYLEQKLDSSVNPRFVAKKYNINPNYMLKRIGELQTEMASDFVLKRNVKQLEMEIINRSKI